MRQIFGGCWASDSNGAASVTPQNTARSRIRRLRDARLRSPLVESIILISSFLQCLENAAHIADCARRGAGPVRHVVERLDRDVARVPVAHERADQRREALLALPRAAPV